jgi:hypothetical protein
MNIKLGYSPEEIFYVLFNNDSSQINFEHLSKKLCYKLQNHNFADSYLAGAKERLGKNRMLSRLDTLSLVFSMSLQKSSLQKTCRLFQPRALYFSW